MRALGRVASRIALPLAASLAASLAAVPAVAQPARVNLYAYVLDVDVPESPAAVALDVAPTRVLRGSAPKPVAATVAWGAAGPTSRDAALAIDVAPYYLLGGGVRDLATYRENSVAGRLARVGTKTLLSLGVVRDAAAPGAPRAAVAIRATLHDPHDPVLNSPLPERVADTLARHGITPSDRDEDVGALGVDVTPLYVAARRDMRARRGIQVSAGWGAAARVGGGIADRDSVDTIHHTLWLTGQRTLGPRVDVLATAEARDAFRGDTRLRVGVALLRKSSTADYRLELYDDRADRRLHPAFAVEGRIAPRLGVTAAVGLAPDRPVGAARSVVQARLVVQWHAGQRS